MERVFKKYTDWEDYQNGMFDDPPKNIEDSINLSLFLLRDEELFYKVGLNVICNWKNSSEVNLTNKSSNRRSWVGQACCSYMFQVTERATRKAWSILTEKEKVIANKVADKIIDEYERRYREVH
jgi:hypothetical protein